MKYLHIILFFALSLCGYGQIASGNYLFQRYNGTTYDKVIVVPSQGPLVFDGTGAVTTPTLSTGTTIELGNVTLTGTIPADRLGSGGGAGKFLRYDNTWQTISASGDVVGPSSAMDNAVVRFDGITGKLIQDSAILIQDFGGITFPSGTNDPPGTAGTAGLVYIKGGNAAPLAGANGGDAGSITMTGGNAAQWNDGSDHAVTGGIAGGINMSGGDGVTDGTTYGANGGNAGPIDTHGAIPSGATNGGNGGAIFTYGSSDGFNGGHIYTYGSTHNGGDIDTTAGGSLTTGTGNLSGGNVTGTVLTTAGSGASLTSLNASNISSGTLAVARGGTGITSFGTGVATALGINVGSAGAFTTFNGALGTPSSGTLTNCTGLPISTGVSGLGTNVATALANAKDTRGGVLTALPGYISGCGLSNDGGDASNDLDIAAGVCADSTGAQMMTTSALVKQLDAAWAVGTNQGGLDTGAEATSTWYHVFIICRTDTGVVDALFSTSATAPTMPTNYTLKRRIGSFYNDGSSVIKPFIQDGDWFRWTTFDKSFDTTVANSSTTVTLLTPLGVRTRGQIRVTAATSGTVGFLLTQMDETDSAAVNTFNDAVGSDVIQASAARVQMELMTNTSSQIRIRASTNATAAAIFTRGWIDARGK